MNSNAEEVITTIVDIFTNQGDEEYLGEPVTISEHMLQAAHFAAEAGADEVTIVAALVHDIGHFTSEHGSFTMEDTHPLRSIASAGIGHSEGMTL